MIILQIALIILVPGVILYFQNTKIIKIVGVIAMTYLIGLLFALIIYILQRFNLNIKLDKTIGEDGSFIMVAVSIPLLLFSSNLKEIKKLSKEAIMSWISLVISVIIVCIFIYYIYSKRIDYGKELTAMATGLYTGGTPNLNAIGEIFNVPTNIISIANLSDMIFGGIFYLFVLFIGKPLLSRVLKEKKEASYSDILDNKKEDSKNVINILINVGLATVLCMVGAGIGLLFCEKYLVPLLMVIVTIGGVLLSFNKRISSVKQNNTIGMYFILMFSFSISSILDISSITVSFLSIFLLFMIITITVLVVHVVIAKILGLDVDITIVTLIAGIYGPAFVPPIVKQIGNDELMAPGLICGSFGYAIGTILGIIISFVLI